MGKLQPVSSSRIELRRDHQLIGNCFWTSEETGSDQGVKGGAGTCEL
jgi:hypothetical protein